MSVAGFIYQLNKLGFSIWLENGKVKYRQYKEYPNNNEVISQITNNKNKINILTHFHIALQSRFVGEIEPLTEL